MPLSQVLPGTAFWHARRRGCSLDAFSFFSATSSTGKTGSCLHGKARSSKICRRLGQPDDSREAVRVVGHGDGQEAQGTGLAGRGWQSNHTGARQWLLHSDAAQGWHPVLYVEQATGRGTYAGAWLPKTRPAGGQGA